MAVDVFDRKAASGRLGPRLLDDVVENVPRAGFEPSARFAASNEGYPGGSKGDTGGSAGMAGQASGGADPARPPAPARKLATPAAADRVVMVPLRRPAGAAGLRTRRPSPR